MTQTFSRRDLLTGIGATAIGFDAAAGQARAADAREAKGFVFEAEPGQFSRRPGTRGRSMRS